ncbi:MAG: CobD/CbiB family cobalamin biosynthesis protein [Haloferacaceae archaeon]
MTALAAGAAVLVAGLLDAAVGEPPLRVHPVALFGRATAPLAGRSALAGLAGALLLPVGFAAVAALAVAAVAAWPPLEVAVAALVLFATTSRRMLCGEARAVIAATAEDPAAARTRLRSLAGRDAAALSPAEVRSAAVESAAENLADGLVAPLSGFAAGVAVGASVGHPLAGGAAGTAWVKAVNTLDSMFGYPGRAVGRAPAHLDDAVMWVPARLSAALLALAARAPAAVVAARHDARAPASPNAGWPMATLASAVGVRLEKPGHYALDGGPSLPTAPAAERGVRVAGRAGALAFGLAALATAAAGVVAC